LAPDGTALYAPRGELVVEADGEAVICHVCGRAFRDLSGSHLRHAHRLDAGAYRLLVGLSPRRALQAPALSARRSDVLRARLARDARLRQGMPVGVKLARSGELHRRAEQTRRQTSVWLERKGQLAADGSRLGRARAERYRARREQRARALGFDDLVSFYQARYVDRWLRVERVATELGCSVSAIRGDLARFGLGPDRTRSAGARWRAGR
jgi:ROS/MUCR transcriptional regulator protein